MSLSPHIPTHFQRHASLSHSRLAEGILNVDSPLSHEDSPSVYQHAQHPHQSHSSNIAPQHLFDGATLDGSSSLNNGYSEHTQYVNQRHGSPSLSLLNGSGGGGAVGGGSSQFDLNTADSVLRTRVSELEVINDLFRGRVAELESNESEARQQLEDALRREQELRLRINALEAAAAAANVDDGEERRAKRTHMESFEENSNDMLMESTQPAAQAADMKREDNHE